MPNKYHVYIDDSAARLISTHTAETMEEALAIPMKTYKVRGAGPAKLTATVHEAVGNGYSRYFVTKYATGRVEIKEIVD